MRNRRRSHNVAPEIDIHGIAKIELDPAFPWIDPWESALADVTTLFAPVGTASTTLRLEYERELLDESKRLLVDRFFIGPGGVYDAVLGVELAASPDSSSILLRASGPALEWLSAGLQLALLSSGATLVHAAAAARDGKAVMFPSWGGIGKTALVASLVRERGWQFLGDDFVILGRDGTLYGFPKPMVLYPYHRSLFPELFAGGHGPIAPTWLNDSLGRVAQVLKPALRLSPRLLQLARRHNPQSRQVLPSTAFEARSIARSAELAAVVWLDREPRVREAVAKADDPTVVSRIMGSTLTELHPRCSQALAIAMGIGVVQAENYFEAWSRTLRDALVGRPTHSLVLPGELPVSGVADVVAAELARLGID